MKTLNKIKHLAFYFLAVCIILPRNVTAQELLPLFELPPVVDPNGVVFGVDKIANTFVFTGNADLLLPTDFGVIRLANQYRGSAFRTVTTAVRDDENAQISMTFPTVGGITPFVRGAWLLSQDSRSLGLSSLDRLSGAVGVSAQPEPWWTLEALAGLESTTQLGIQATGPLAGLRTNVTTLPLDQWDLNGALLADWHRIDAQRTNSDLDVNANIFRDLPDGSYLRVGGGYGALARQYFTALQIGATPDEVESRNEDRASFNADVLYNATSTLTFGMLGTLQANNISRQYAEAVTGSPLTAVMRTSQEVIFDLEGFARVGTEWSQVTFGANLFRRNETNVADPVHAIADDELAAIRSQEQQRDNQTARSRWYTRGWWRPSASDTLSAEWNWWLVQYDTPSDQNDDDRDELNAIATVRYVRDLSSGISVGAAISFQYTHYVFLRASRSAQNNENSMLRFSPFVRINGSVVTMQPHFEVLANYYVYDFEGEGASVRSYGFRQVSYRDSIKVRLTERLRVEAPILVRYFERSTLLWDDFAEIPELGNLEYLLRFLIFSRPSPTWDVGAGIRLYTLEQSTLAPVPGLPTVISAVRSWAPEVAVRYGGTGGSSLTLSGWYEFQTLTPTRYRELPNLLLLARVAL